MWREKSRTTILVATSFRLYFAHCVSDTITLCARDMLRQQGPGRAVDIQDADEGRSSGGDGRNRH